MRIIVTRPRREALSWVNKLRSHGLDAVALPLIHISASPNKEAVTQRWRCLHNYQAVMFVSSNAVSYFFQQKEALAGNIWTQSATKTRAWATGPGTQQALIAQSVPPACIDAPAADSKQFDSEALWGRVQSQVKVGDKVLIVRGCTADQGVAGGIAVSGRPWLADQLTAAGVQVDFVASYQRSAPVFDAAEHRVMAQASCDGSLWLLSSSEAVANLMHLTESTPFSRLDWSQARALATHPRIAVAARDAGFGVVYESRPLLADVMASIESLL